jgi:hypothetical protein
VEFGAKGEAAKIEGKNANLLRLAVPASSGQPHRLHGPSGGWLITFPALRTAPDMLQASEFLLAQFEAALGGRPGLTKSDIEEDATAGSLLDLLPFADRDGDGRLSPSELKAYLELVRLGTAAQTWVKVSERGRSLFHFLDADGDGRLAYVELARAANRLNGSPSPATVPWQMQVSFGGPATASWGGVPLPGPRRPRPGAAATLDAPRWFRAMDRNRDGVLSPKEFAGPPERFRRLDADGDGVVTPEEARVDGR